VVELSGQRGADRYRFCYMAASLLDQSWQKCDLQLASTGSSAPQAKAAGVKSASLAEVIASRREDSSLYCGM